MRVLRHSLTNHRDDFASDNSTHLFFSFFLDKFELIMNWKVTVKCEGETLVISLPQELVEDMGITSNTEFELIQRDQSLILRKIDDKKIKIHSALEEIHAKYSEVLSNLA